MNAALRDELKEELRKRGFQDGLVAPNETMTFGGWTFDGDLCDFLDQMVVRREKVSRSVPVVGKEAATQSYGDVLLVIDAIKTVLRRRLGAEVER